MDIADTLAPTSDQLDAVDLLGGPRTFTIAAVSRGKEDQPVNVTLAEFPRVWRPGKSMRRVLAAVYTTDSTKWVGHKVTLYCDESVMFGGERVGGVRISHMTGIDKPRAIPLLVKRRKSAMFTVQPLVENAAEKPVDPLATLWARIREAGIPNTQAKAFTEAAIGHELTRASDVTADEAAEVLGNFDALLADWVEEVAR